MKTILSLLIFLPYIILSQDVSVTISSDKPVYTRDYNRNSETDYLHIKYTLHNNTDDTIRIKFEPYFELDYIPGEYGGYGSCFRMYQKGPGGKGWLNTFKYDDYSSFVKIAPKDSLQQEGEFDIYWPCRSAPPSENWEFNIKYSRVLKSDDNFFLFSSRYTDFSSKEYIKAWEGEISSNVINIKIVR